MSFGEQGGMVSLNSVGSSHEAGSETTNLHQRLLLSGASREVVRDKLFDMANYYIDKTDDP